MPTYQYRCVDCGSELEVVQKFTDASLTECPECDGSLRKVYSAVGVVFKGSGFYRTDSRADGSAGGSSSSSSSSSGSGASSSGSGSTSGGSSSSGTSGSGSSPAASTGSSSSSSSSAAS